MTDIITKIGDHFILINCESKKLTEMFKKNFQTIKYGENQKNDLLIEIKEGYGVPFLDYEVEITKLKDKILFRQS